MKKNIINIIKNAGNFNKGEKALILFDSKTKDVAELFYKEALSISNVQMIELPVFKNHGSEPDKKTTEVMQQVDLIFCLTNTSLAHSKARINANDNGVRFLSLPGYSLDMLKNKSVSVDFKKYLIEVKGLTEILSTGKTARVTTEKGTDIALNLQNRTANCCAGFVDNFYRLGSPPDIESNIAPNEKLSNGIIIVDGSITTDNIALLQEDVILTVKDGIIKEFESIKYAEVLNKMFDNNKKRVLAELGIGFNPEAKICGNMLIDEGARGHIHFGFGSNSTIGGNNNAGFHLDFVIKEPTLYVDDKIIISKGEIL